MYPRKDDDPSSPCTVKSRRADVVAVRQAFDEGITVHELDESCAYELLRRYSDYTVLCRRSSQGEHSPCVTFTIKAPWKYEVNLRVEYGSSNWNSTHTLRDNIKKMLPIPALLPNVRILQTDGKLVPLLE